MPNRRKSINSVVGNKIKELRNSRKMTQKELAELLYKSESTVRMWELGKSEPDLEMLKTIAEFFNVSTDYILGITHKPIMSGYSREVILPMYSDHEQEVITAYRNNPDMQGAVDRLLGIEDESPVQIYRAARSDDHDGTEIAPPSGEHLENITKAPAYDAKPTEQKPQE